MSIVEINEGKKLDHFLLGSHELEENNAIKAIFHFLLAFKLDGSPKRAILEKALQAYETVELTCFANIDGNLEFFGQTINVREVERIAKLVKKEGGQALQDKILLLAESDLLDVQYVAKQLGKSIASPYEAAFDFYTHFHKRLRPNVYFNPLYFAAMNQLENNEDPVSHYLLANNKADLEVHRLFDINWLKSQDSEIVLSSCPINYYWKHCYPKRITSCDPNSVELDDRIKQFFFFEAQFPFLSSPEEIEKVKDKVQAVPQLKALVDFFSQKKASPRQIPIDFNPYDYLDLHKDMMAKYKDNPIDSLGHYLLHGIFEERPYNLDERFSYRLAKKRVFDTSQLQTIKQKKPLCVLMHLYYVDLWPVLRSYIDNIDVEFDLHINMVDSTWTSEAVCLIRKDYPNAVIKISPNEGRDIGGYFNLLKTIEVDGYLAFITMHSKKSQHITEKMLVNWRTNLLQAILGSEEIIRNNLAAFIEDPSVGIIGSALHREDAIGQNEEGYEQLLDLYQISEENRDCEYVSGTMMMLRSDIVKRIYEVAKNLSFNNADNKGLDFLIDGQLEHALERVFGNVMKELGYKFYWG